MKVLVVDPYIENGEARSEYDLDICATIPTDSVFDVAAVMVSHHQFSTMKPKDWLKLIH